MGTITSTRFYADGPEKDKHKSVDPYTKNKKNKKLKLNQQLSESQEMEFETFEPSANYHDETWEEDDVYDPNRPSSTIFTPLDVEEHSEERVFFPAPPPQQSDLSDDESDYDGMSEDDGFGPRMSMVRNAKPRKERIQKQNSISVSGHHGQGLIDEYDDDHNDHNGAFGGGSFDDDEQQNDDDDNGGYGSMVDSGDEDEESSYLGTESD